MEAADTGYPICETTLAIRLINRLDMGIDQSYVETVFKDRHDAGRKLAAKLKRFRPENPVVLALPRGGVPIASEIAEELSAPLDVFAVRKVGAPQNPEFAIGAVAEDGVALIDQQTVSQLGIGSERLKQLIGQTATEARQQRERFRSGRPLIDIDGKTVIVVDDGLATGLTDLAALRAIRTHAPKQMILAVPVASSQAFALARKAADEVVALKVTARLDGVGRWYSDFNPVSDREVLQLLGRTCPSAETDTDKPHEGKTGNPVESRRAVQIDLGEVQLKGDLRTPASPLALVLFAHGSGSSRLSPRNIAVAEALGQTGLATLLFDLLTDRETDDRAKVFDIDLLAKRLVAVTHWAVKQPNIAQLPLGYFGASTGAAAALQAATELGSTVGAVVSRGGRPDLAADHLPSVTAPTLLIVGGEDRHVLELNRRAAARLKCLHKLTVIDGATHLFEEPGALEKVCELAQQWFCSHLAGHPIDTAYRSQQKQPL